MQQIKTQLKVAQDSLELLHDDKDETGMGFLIVETSVGYVAVLANGDALPLYSDANHYDVDSLLAGDPAPALTDTVQLVSLSIPKNRTDARLALKAAKVSPRYTGTVGASPLIYSHALATKTNFFRLLNSSTDPRFDGASGKLSGGTYLTTSLDRMFVNSGFGVVGRYALPIPLPASHVIEYEFATGTSILVGTVAPMFGQAGGGVEVRLSSAQTPTRISKSVVPNY